MFLYLCTCFPLNNPFFLFNASKSFHDEKFVLCRVEFDRLTDLLRARIVEPDPPTSIVSHKEKNEDGFRIDGIGGSSSHQMTADESPMVKVRTKPVDVDAQQNRENRAILEEDLYKLQSLFQYLCGQDVR